MQAYSHRTDEAGCINLSTQPHGKSAGHYPYELIDLLILCFADVGGTGPLSAKYEKEGRRSMKKDKMDNAWITLLEQSYYLKTEP